MGPTIILDKSALQALSQPEMTALHRYYLLNVVPVLLIEILGDLKKPSAHGLSESRVAELAQKAFPVSAAMTVHYRALLKGSLMGKQVEMRGRPVLGQGRAVRAGDGQKGIVFEETPEEKALLRWRSHSFLAAEEVLAERWRTSTRELDIDEFRASLKGIWPMRSEIRDLPTLYEFTNSLLRVPEHQTELLKLVMFEFGLGFEFAQRVFLRWETEGPQDIEKFSPFAYHCLKVSLFFKLGLVHDVIGTRRTNRVDIEYLYYLPFCNVFCSGDKFHISMVPLFLRPDQRFINRDELKPDLARLSADLVTAGPAGIKRTPEESLTTSLWNQFMSGPMSEHGWIDPDAVGRGAGSKLADFIKRKAEGMEIRGREAEFNTDEADFVIKKTTMLPTDPCPCGNRKAFADCHGKNIVNRDTEG